MSRTVAGLSRRVSIPLAVAAFLVGTASCGDPATAPEAIALKPLRPTGSVIASCAAWPGAADTVAARAEYSDYGIYFHLSPTLPRVVV